MLLKLKQMPQVYLKELRNIFKYFFCTNYY